MKIRKIRVICVLPKLIGSEVQKLTQDVEPLNGEPLNPWILEPFASTKRENNLFDKWQATSDPGEMRCAVTTWISRGKQVTNDKWRTKMEADAV